MNLSPLFRPVSFSLENPFGLNDFLGQSVSVATHEKDYAPQQLESADIIVAGLPAFDGHPQFTEVLKTIRTHLYALRSLSLSIVDLGDFSIPKEHPDYVAGIQLFVETVASWKARILLLSEDTLPSAILQALAKQKTLNITCLNNHFRSLEKLQEMMQQGLSVGNFALLGYQNYLVDAFSEAELDRLSIEPVRLSAVSHSPDTLEPYLYDADWAHLSVNVVKSSDAPATLRPSPNGLSGTEFCQTAYFAGLGGRTQWLSISDINPEKDYDETAHLAAQAFWLFLDGIVKHIDEHPFGNNKHIQRFIVINEVYKRHFVFYKSMLSGRWWLEVPTKDKTTVIATSYRDYKMAGQQDIPERWWRFFKRNSSEL
jgi:arginase family enzyme